MAPTRVLAIGLCESPWRVLRDPSFEAHLPFLTGLAARAASGTTLTPSPRTPDPMWATVVTGRSSGGHGIFGSPQRKRGGSFHAVSDEDLAVPPIWRVLENAGVPTGTFNVNINRWSEPTSGFMIAHGIDPAFVPACANPPALYRSLRRRFGDWPVTSVPRTNAEWTSRLPGEIEERTDVLVHLLRARPWQFALTQLPEISRAQHRFWADAFDPGSPWHHTLRAVYAVTDRCLARIVEAAGPETIVFVFSECGAGQLRHGVQLDAFLEKEGFLLRRKGSRQPLASKATGLVGRHFRHAAHRLFPSLADRWTETLILKAKSLAPIAADTSDFDWSRTRAFSPGANDAIHFNVAGRDPRGIVPESERAHLTRDLRARLIALRDPEGRRVVEDVIPQHAWRAHREIAPDLTVVWVDDAYVSARNPEERDRVFVEWRPGRSRWRFTGAHRREGMLLVHGPGIEPADVGGIDTRDLVPTWLDLLGVPIPEGVEGSSFASRLLSPGRVRILASEAEGD